MATNLMPAAYIGHGTVRNAWQDTIFTDTWRDFAKQIPRPRSILMVSAHWYVLLSAVTAGEAPRTVHDFYGGSPEQQAFSYPCPGSPALADRVVELLSPQWVGLDTDSWGLDHGSWVVLTHAFPEADIPVVELSVNARLSFDEHVELGRRLAPLREEGVLVISSGSLIHGPVYRDGQPTADFPAAMDYLEELDARLTTEPASVARLGEHRVFPVVAPTPEHFIPVLYFAGMCDAAEDSAQLLINGPEHGGIGMTSYTLGLE
jgi:4,5-DOPA dioxygenase extradiol